MVLVDVDGGVVFWIWLVIKPWRKWLASGPVREISDRSINSVRVHRDWEMDDDEIHRWQVEVGMVVGLLNLILVLLNISQVDEMLRLIDRWLALKLEFIHFDIRLTCLIPKAHPLVNCSPMILRTRLTAGWDWQRIWIFVNCWSPLVRWIGEGWSRSPPHTVPYSTVTVLLWHDPAHITHHPDPRDQIPCCPTPPLHANLGLVFLQLFASWLQVLRFSPTWGNSYIHQSLCPSNITF